MAMIVRLMTGAYCLLMGVSGGVACGEVYWVTEESGVVHNERCYHYKNSKGYETERPRGQDCEKCGGASGEMRRQVNVGGQWRISNEGNKRGAEATVKPADVKGNEVGKERAKEAAVNEPVAKREAEVREEMKKKEAERKAAAGFKRGEANEAGGGELSRGMKAFMFFTVLLGVGLGIGVLVEWLSRKGKRDLTI